MQLQILTGLYLADGIGQRTGFQHRIAGHNGYILRLDQFQVAICISTNHAVIAEEETGIVGVIRGGKYIAGSQGDTHLGRGCHSLHGDGLVFGQVNIGNGIVHNPGCTAKGYLTVTIDSFVQVDTAAGWGAAAGDLTT